MAEIPEKRHEFSDAGGELDEVFVSNAFVHIERMDDTAFWIGIDPPKESGLPRLMLNTGVYRGTWFFNIEEDTLGKDGFHSVQRPRRAPYIKRSRDERSASLESALKTLAEAALPYQDLDPANATLGSALALPEVKRLLERT